MYIEFSLSIFNILIVRLVSFSKDWRSLCHLSAIGMCTVVYTTNHLTPKGILIYNESPPPLGKESHISNFQFVQAETPFSLGFRY